MDVTEVVALRKQAEDYIERALRDLEADTGCVVRGAGVRVVDHKAEDGTEWKRRSVWLDLALPS